MLQQFPDGRVLLADKQFYASRQLDTALMIALAVPNADYTSFDLVVSVKARADAMGGIAATRAARPHRERDDRRAEDVPRVDPRQHGSLDQTLSRNSRIKAAFLSFALNHMSASGPTTGMAPSMTSTSTFDSIFDTSDGGGPY